MMYKNITAVVCFLVFVANSNNATANESEARNVFITGATSALNFKSYQIVEEISLAFPHFTANGTDSLISFLENNAIISQAVSKNGSLKTTIKRNSIQVQPSIHNNTDKYLINAEAEILWQRCVQKTCVPVGESKKQTISAEVVKLNINNRPVLKINYIGLK